MCSHLFRRIYQAGIQNKTWSLISNLHQEAKSCIKWKSSNFEMFDVKMGVRQGGILSADLYKLYINPLLDHLQNVNVGHRIGNIKNNNTGCGDDCNVICFLYSSTSSGGFRGGRAGRARPPPPKIRKANVIQR